VMMAMATTTSSRLKPRRRRWVRRMGTAPFPESPKQAARHDHGLVALGT
jgi:hypothetical protein